ncbi:hypothetical protein BH11PLA2_BH11PLA2_11050 [soil metagenome]
MANSLHRRNFRFVLESFEERINPDNLPNGMPILHSRPAAPVAIFMDFDGETTANVTAYDTGGDATTFDTTEQNVIIEAWRQLSAYYAPFDVNVTTIYPGSTPKAWICIGNNISGGYSYVNVFPNSEPESFNQSSDARSRVSGLAHEVGHNFGLSHQSEFNTLGVETADYRGAIETLRGPIMGVDYAGTVHKFSIGHTSNASGLQDDVATIAADIDNYQPAGGDGMRVDDYGNTIATATAMNVNGSTQFMTAVIERNTDVDVYSFFTSGGRVSLTAAPDVPSGVDLTLEVRDAANTLLAVADTPQNGQTLTMTLPAGTYYALVASKGNYADIGAYSVSVTEGAPDGFQSTNVGLQAYTGHTSYNSAADQWTVSGSGNDIWNAADQFQFAWKYLSGDGTIIARVTGIDSTNTNAKAGVMIRESLSEDSRHASTFSQYGAAAQMVYRTSTAGSAASVNNGSNTFVPRWVRLTKSGNSITSQYSTSTSTTPPTSWTTISTKTVNVGTAFYVGLATTSHDTGKINNATYTDVIITGFTDPLAVTNVALGVPQNLAVTLGTANGLNLTWDAVTGASGYSVERSSDGVTFLPLAATTTATYSDTNPTGSQRYFYRVRATDAAGRSDVSSVVNLVNRPSAVRSLEFTSYTSTSIVLDWLDTGGETGFRIEKSTDGLLFSPVTTVGKNIPSYTVTGLTASTPYAFRVIPTSSLGDGAIANAVTGSTRLAAVTTLTFSSVNSNSVVLNWTAVAAATGYRIERSPDNTTFTSVGTTTAAVTFTDSTVSPETEYYYRVIATNASTESAAGGRVVMAGTPPTVAIASPWISTDIGLATDQKGMSSLTGGTFKVISGGADIWGTADNFRFTYQQLTGNGVITARVASVENTGGWAKIGVMIRETLAAGSRQAHTFITPGNGVNTQVRTSTGGTSSSKFQATGVTAPEWVRMVRKGNVLTGYYSADGVTWTQAGTVTISGLAATIFFGLSANAYSASTLNTSTFDNVSVFSNTVNSTVIDNGLNQRSKVRSVTVKFNGLVTLPVNPVNAFTVVRTGGSNPSFTVDLSGSTATQTIAKLNFTGDTIANGLYTLTVLATQVTDASGFGLGTMAANVTTTFHRLLGDSNGDRTVNGADLTTFGNAFATSSTQSGFNDWYDFNIDGTINGADLVLFGNQFGSMV